MSPAARSHVWNILSVGQASSAAAAVISLVSDAGVRRVSAFSRSITVLWPKSMAEALTRAPSRSSAASAFQSASAGSDKHAAAAPISSALRSMGARGGAMSSSRNGRVLLATSLETSVSGSTYCGNVTFVTETMQIRLSRPCNEQITIQIQIARSWRFRKHKQYLHASMSHGMDARSNSSSPRCLRSDFPIRAILQSLLGQQRHHGRLLPYDNWRRAQVLSAFGDG